ncbi:MAG: hypothetical protein AAF927_10090 [Bacteroidota bacterium]
MNFDNLQKVWDAQNNAPMYQLNESALHQIVLRKSRKAARYADINDFGLMGIMLVSSALLLFLDRGSLYAYLSAVCMLGIATYVGYQRWRRKRHNLAYDQSILGQLEQAIANTESEIRRSRNFVWWMLAPAAVPSLINMVQSGAPIWKICMISAAFVLSYFVTQWGLKSQYLPRKRSLEALRKKLTEALD